MSNSGNGSPGGHPHTDRPNWRPAETVDEYLENCEAGLEEFSERRLAKLWGVPRVELQRWKLMAELPTELVDRLLKGGVCSTKALAQVALALRRGGNAVAEVECCPNCGHVIRGRQLVEKRARNIVNQWIEDGAPE